MNRKKNSQAPNSTIPRPLTLPPERQQQRQQPTKNPMKQNHTERPEPPAPAIQQNKKQNQSHQEENPTPPMAPKKKNKEPPIVPTEPPQNKTTGIREEKTSPDLRALITSSP
jgi:hypothetical protein